MSYLDPPRINVAGRFFCDPGTVNNFTTNYGYPERIKKQQKWNPSGFMAWAFRDCQVTSIVNDEDPADPSKGVDPLTDSTFELLANPAPAKITSLDVQSQIAYELWGASQFRITTSEGESVTGRMRTAQFSDGWQRTPMPSGVLTNNDYYTARLQSIIEVEEWSPPPDQKHSSALLRRLREFNEDALSIRMVVDGYSINTIGGLTGRIVATIGPFAEGEPIHYVAGRMLRPPAEQYKLKIPYMGTPFFFAPFKETADGSSVVLDLGNSVPTTVPGGPPQDYGELHLVALAAGVEPGALLEPRHDLGKIDYLGDAYTQRGFVQSLPVPPGCDISSTPLGLVLVEPDPPHDSPLRVSTVFLSEDPFGEYVFAETTPYSGPSREFIGDGNILRMNPGDRQQVELTALAFGRPMSGRQIGLAQSSDFFNFMAGDQGVSGKAPPDTPEIGVPEAALIIESSDGTPIDSVITNSAGRATFSLKAGNPKKPRYDGKLDGQLYGVSYSVEAPQHVRSAQNIWNVVLIQVYDADPLPEPEERLITWTDVAKILTPYAQLYPYMDRYVRLDEEEVVSTPHTARLIRDVLSLPITNSNYMPVTRDLSRDKREWILRWIEQIEGDDEDG